MPFKLPDFIEETGITKVRESSNDANKTLKQRMKERMQPKLGKLDIDYQVLHDAFFKNQTKPRLSIHGDVYYEGKEYEVKMRVYKPGRISPDLCHALGIPESSPPPWLINMQRFGPPPAYPSLKIPGVNAPIPDSMHYGQGKYAQDDKNFTVYADCYGLQKPANATPLPRTQALTYWGQARELPSESSSSAGEEMSEEDIDRESVGEYIPSEDEDEGMRSMNPLDVQIGGVDIRKRELQRKAEGILTRDGVEVENQEEVKPLYKILKEVDAEVDDKQLMGTGHTYEYPDKKETEVKEPKEEPKDEIKKPKKEKKEKIKYKF